MKKIHYNAEKQLVLKHDVILGSTYELQNVLIEQENLGEQTTTKMEKKCRHPKSARQEIGNRILCGVCNQYLKSSTR